MADARPAGGGYVEPYRAYNFVLSVEGIADARFAQCSALGVRIHPIAYREGGRGAVTRRLPGPVEYAEVTLRYGLTSSHSLFDWLLEVAGGNVQRKHVTLTIEDNAGGTPVQWHLIDAWPCAWQGAPLDALGREVAIESLTLIFESLQRG